MKRTLICLLCCLPLMLWAERQYTTIEVLRPGRVTFDQQVARLLLVNNSVIQPDNYGHLQSLSNAEPVPQTLKADSLAFLCLMQAAADLQETGYFEEVSVLDESQNRSDNFFAVSRLSSTQADSLCRLYEADALLVLDRYCMIDVLSNAHDQEAGIHVAALDLKTQASWTLYQPGAAAQPIVQADSLYWEREAGSLARALTLLPELRDAAEEAAIRSAGRFAAILLPRWQLADRFFYTSRKVSAGMEHVYHQQWSQALKQFEQAYAEQKKPLERAYAANNAAVCCELTGDLNSALQWANKAVEQFSAKTTSSALTARERAQHYVTQLEQRLRELSQLLLQL